MIIFATLFCLVREPIIKCLPNCKVRVNHRLTNSGAITTRKRDQNPATKTKLEFIETRSKHPVRSKSS